MHRTKQRCGQVFRCAIATGRAERDPTSDLRGVLAPMVVKHRAAIVDPVQISGLLRAIYSYRGRPATEAALKLAAMLFVRGGELRKAEWFEFNLEGSEWRIPPARMKMRTQHVVPLATQAVDVLTQLREFTGRSHYVFPSLRSRERPMSKLAITAALRRKGYSGEEMTWRGFSRFASTCLNERG